MTDRVYPSAKPSIPASTTFPVTKAQLYGATRPAYRPQPKPQRRHRRSCCCGCCLWTTLLLIALILVVAIAAAVFWVVYRPQRPSFSLTTLRISQFNLTTSHLNSNIDVALSVRNPNKRLLYLYDPISFTIISDEIQIADGSFPAFLHPTKNTTLLKPLVPLTKQIPLDPASKNFFDSHLSNKNGLPMLLQLHTKVRVKIGSYKTKKFGIKVTCNGIQATLPKGKPSLSSHPTCKVNLRIKIWKWTF